MKDELKAELRDAMDRAALDATQSLLVLVDEAEPAALDEMISSLEAEESAPDPERAGALRMAFGAALARRASHAGDVADATNDVLLQRLDEVAAMAPGSKRAEAFAPLGAYLLSHDVPAWIDMKVGSTLDECDDVVAGWTSGVMALKRLG